MLIAISFSSYCQIDVKKGAPCQDKEEVNKGFMGTGYFIKLQKCDGYYSIMFRDTRYQEIVQIESFIIKDEDIEELAKIIISGFDKPEETRVTLSDQTIVLDYHSSMGVTQLRFMYYVNNAYFATSSYIGVKKAKQLFSSI